MDRMQPEMGISHDRLFAARIIEQGRELLAGIQRLGVAFSGGVDSSVLLALAVKVLSPTHVVAILGVSPSLAVTKFEKSWHELVETVRAALEGGDKAAAQKRASHKGQQTGTS